jgi:peptide/nickel transport system permease protein
MTKILVRWLIGTIPVLLIVSVLTFVLSSLVPGNAARNILGINATAEQVDLLTREMGLNDPLPIRYWNWLTGAVQGDLGVSVINGQQVSEAIGVRVGATASLIIGALVLAAVLGVTLGIVSALRGGWVGKLVDVIAVVGLAIPGFWFGLVLVALFAVGWQIFPATGYVAPGVSIAEWLRSLVLPVVTLAVPAAAPVAKQTRDGMLTALGKDYVRVLRARGISERSIVMKHALRNAAAPVVTVLGIIAVVLLGGTVLVETVFLIPGLGGLSVSATATHDIPMIQGLAVVFAIIVMIVNLAIEIVYAVINPKVRT